MANRLASDKAERPGGLAIYKFQSLQAFQPSDYELSAIGYLPGTRQLKS